MSFHPPRLLGLLFGGLLLVLLLAAAGLGVVRLAEATISPWLVLWVSLPLTAVPLAAAVAYRAYGLLTASYRLDRNGFYLRWGLASEQIPLAAVSSVRMASAGAGELPGPHGLWWPGCVVGRCQVESLGLLEYFAASGPPAVVLLTASDRSLALSPGDPEAFCRAYLDATRLGSLEPIPHRSQRPDFFFARLWADPVARGLVMAGLALPMLLLGYLAVRAPALPARVPFGFDPTGAPAPWAPPGRMLLLPLIAGVCWIADLAAGAWLYRREGERLLAYGLWATAVAVGILLWGAALRLLAVVG